MYCTSFVFCTLPSQLYLEYTSVHVLCSLFSALLGIEVDGRVKEETGNYSMCVQMKCVVCLSVMITSLYGARNVCAYPGHTHTDRHFRLYILDVSTEVLKKGNLCCCPFALPLSRWKNRWKDFETGFQMSLCAEHRHL